MGIFIILLYIIWAIKSGRMSEKGHVAHTGRKRMHMSSLRKPE